MEYKGRLMLNFVWESNEAANDSTQKNNYKDKTKERHKRNSQFKYSEVKLSCLVILEALCSDNLRILFVSNISSSLNIKMVKLFTHRSYYIVEEFRLVDRWIKRKAKKNTPHFLKRHETRLKSRTQVISTKSKRHQNCQS